MPVRIEIIHPPTRRIFIRYSLDGKDGVTRRHEIDNLLSVIHRKHAYASKVPLAELLVRRVDIDDDDVALKDTDPDPITKGAL